ncbi:MAG: hypothetical protein HW387_244 [Parachlamydiales bacterium]|nr:hypothetical protein [Parachlamydiales bacterium]
MKIKAIILSVLFFPGLCHSLEVQPWFGDVFEFHFLGSYVYSRFNSVQGGDPQLKSPFNSNLGYLGLEFCPTSDWSIDGDVQVADTTAVPFNFRSVALQLRYLWADDIVGNPVTFSTGANFRATSESALRDVSCPSHANVDFEMNFALGKEFDASESWRWRLWCFGALGQANRGSPWVRAMAAVETNIDDKHKWGLLAIGSNGYGRHSHVNTEHFNGYGKIRQKSIDVGIRYGYRTGVWGTLRVEYQRRVLAKACPQNVNAFIFSYLLPFSL